MSSKPLTKVLILGATGNIGRPILSTLLADSAFTVTVAVRPSSKPALPPNVRTVPIDYADPSTFALAFTGIDAIISCITTFATPQQQALIDAAVKAGVRRFIPSEFGVDTSKPVVEEFIPATKLKRDTVAYLRRTEQQMSWTAVIVGTFFDWALMNSFGGYDWKEKTAMVLGDEDVPTEHTNLGKIAEAVVRILRHGEETANQYVYVHSFRVSQREIREAVEKATGEKFKQNHLNIADFHAQGLANSSTTEINAGVAQSIQAVLYGYRAEEHINDFEDKAPHWLNILGMEEESLKGTVKRVVEELK